MDISTWELEVGKLMYNLTDYTTSVYFRVDTAYHQLTNAGNFIWSFSNSTNQGTDQNGYIIGALNNQSVSITPKYYTAASGNQAVSFATAALQGRMAQPYLHAEWNYRNNIY